MKTYIDHMYIGNGSFYRTYTEINGNVDSIVYKPSKVNPANVKEIDRYEVKWVNRANVKDADTCPPLLIGTLYLVDGTSAVIEDCACDWESAEDRLANILNA